MYNIKGVSSSGDVCSKQMFTDEFSIDYIC
jgi:hypothetical protein